MRVHADLLLAFHLPVSCHCSVFFIVSFSTQGSSPTTTLPIAHRLDWRVCPTDSDLISFVRNGELWLERVSTGLAQQLTHVRGTCSPLAVSTPVLTIPKQPGSHPMKRSLYPQDSLPSSSKKSLIAIPVTGGLLMENMSCTSLWTRDQSAR
jgi:hypothetical protein